MDGTLADNVEACISVAGLTWAQGMGCFQLVSAPTVRDRDVIGFRWLSSFRQWSLHLGCLFGSFVVGTRQEVFVDDLSVQLSAAVGLQSAVHRASMYIPSKAIAHHVNKNIDGKRKAWVWML